MLFRDRTDAGRQLRASPKILRSESLKSGSGAPAGTAAVRDFAQTSVDKVRSLLEWQLDATNCVAL